MHEDLRAKAEAAKTPISTLMTISPDVVLALLDECDRLRKALAEIEDRCPVTCDMTLAHEMAETARAALAEVDRS